MIDNKEIDEKQNDEILLEVRTFLANKDKLVPKGQSYWIRESNDDYYFDKTQYDSEDEDEEE